MPRIELGAVVEEFITWLLRAVPGLFDGISAVLTVLVDAISTVLLAPSFLVWVGAFGLVALLVRGVGLAVFTVVAFLLVASMNLWPETMETLAVVLVAAVLATAIGVPLGIWAAQNRGASTVLRPVLDFMQTTPVFVYLIPAVFFFGIGVVPGVVATTIFSIPPPCGSPNSASAAWTRRSWRPPTPSAPIPGRSCARSSCRWRCPRSWRGSTR